MAARRRRTLRVRRSSPPRSAASIRRARLRSLGGRDSPGWSCCVDMAPAASARSPPPLQRGGGGERYRTLLVAFLQTVQPPVHFAEGGSVELKRLPGGHVVVVAGRADENRLQHVGHVRHARLPAAHVGGLEVFVPTDR